MSFLYMTFSYLEFGLCGFSVYKHRKKTPKETPEIYGCPSETDQFSYVCVHQEMPVKKEEEAWLLGLESPPGPRAPPVDGGGTEPSYKNHNQNYYNQNFNPQLQPSFQPYNLDSNQNQNYNPEPQL